MFVCIWGKFDGLLSRKLGQSPLPESFIAASPRCCQVGNAGNGKYKFGLPWNGKTGVGTAQDGLPGSMAEHRIDNWFCADPTGAPAILQVDSCPQAILKFRPPNSLD